MKYKCEVYCNSGSCSEGALRIQISDLEVTDAAAAFSMEAKMLEARVLRFRCTLKNNR